MPCRARGVHRFGVGTPSGCRWRRGPWALCGDAAARPAAEELRSGWDVGTTQPSHCPVRRVHWESPVAQGRVPARADSPRSTSQLLWTAGNRSPGASPSGFSVSPSAQVQLSLRAGPRGSDLADDRSDAHGSCRHGTRKGLSADRFRAWAALPSTSNTRCGIPDPSGAG